jgi:hypothetical protein
MVRSGRGPFKPAWTRRARAMHEMFFENLRNPVHIRRVGLMRQFCPGQVYSNQKQAGEPSIFVRPRIVLWSPILDLGGSVLKRFRIEISRLCNMGPLP